MLATHATVRLARVSARPVEVADVDGPRRGFLASPDREEWKSAVVVVGEHGAIDARTKAVCRDLARDGHGALALDLHAYTDPTWGDPGGLLPQPPLLFDRLTGAVRAGIAVLQANAPSIPSRVGVVGYGFGGFVALLAGYRCQVGVALSFYGEGPLRLRHALAEIIERRRPQAARLVCFVGAEDSGVRPDDLRAVRERLDACEVRHTFIIYPKAKGSFSNPGSADYRAAYAEDAWSKLTQALETAHRQRHRFGKKTST